MNESICVECTRSYVALFTHYRFAVHVTGTKTNDKTIKNKGRITHENLIIIRKWIGGKRIRQKLHKLMLLQSQHWLHIQKLELHRKKVL